MTTRTVRGRRYAGVALAVTLLLAAAPAAAQQEFCAVLKLVLADAQNEFTGIRLKEKADGSWTVGLSLPGTNGCEVEDLFGYYYTCDIRTDSRAAADAEMARLERAIGQCLPDRTLERKPRRDGLPTLTFRQADSKFDVRVTMSEVLRRHIVTIWVDD